MSDDHEALLANMNLSIMQQHKYILDSLVQQIWETVEKVSQSDDNVRLNTEFNIWMNKSEKSVKILRADLLRDAHVLAESKDSWSF